MISEEIRRNTFDKNGKRHNKLACMAVYREDSIAISIKNRDFVEGIEVDISTLMGSYADEKEIEDMKVIFKSIYERAKHTGNIAS